MVLKEKFMKYIFLFILLRIASVSFGQDGENEEYVDTSPQEPPYSFKEHLYTGGNFGFSISGGLMYLEISPLLGYKINENLSMGISSKYVYIGPVNKTNNLIQSYKYYGGGVFSQYKITESLAAILEYQLLNVENVDPNSSKFRDRVLSNSLLLGGGYRSEVLGGVNINLYLLYDVIDDVNSPYRYNYIFGPNNIPIIYRLGFTYGF